MTLVMRIGVPLLLVVGLFLLPDADRARLAARQAHELFAEKPIGADATFGELVLAGAHVYERDGERMKFALAGVRLQGADMADHGHLHLRRSIIQGLRTTASAGGISLVVPGEKMPVVRGAAFLGWVSNDKLFLQYEPLEGDAIIVSKRYREPDRTSLVPPIVAVALAILFRRPLLALFCGVLAGAFLVELRTGSGLLASAGGGFLDVGRVYFWNELVAGERAMIVAFVVFMLAMVGVITKNGGIRGLMNRISSLAGTARSTQVATYLMGLVVFFDDYANTILVGSTMRPLTDRFRIAREKLAYIVDSTAAPVAGISVFSTWIAFEVSTFSAQLPAAGLLTSEGYAVFLQTLPYRFYCVFTLALVALVVFTGRDFGPMLVAEKRARSTGKLVRDGGRPMVGSEATHMEPAAGVVPRARLAVAPILLFIFATLFEIARAGGAFGMGSALFTLEGMTSVLYDGSGSRPLMVGSGAGLLLAIVLSLAVGLRGEILGAAWTTLRSMGVALGILYLAWMIGAVCQNDLGTGPYLSELLTDALDPVFLPMLLFVLAGAIAFATGSSWSTMSILLPLVVGISFTMGEDNLPHLGGMGLMILSIGAVLEGAIFGDHCSPISDTTVMSSIASASDHIDHVRTQAPYAILTMIVAMVAGYFPCTFIEGYSPWYGWVVGLGLLVLVLVLRGKRADAAPEPIA